MGQRIYTKGTERENYSKVRNNFIKEKYDRLNLTFPKGKKEIYQAAAQASGKSLNSLINELLENYIKQNENF